MKRPTRVKASSLPRIRRLSRRFARSVAVAVFVLILYALFRGDALAADRANFIVIVADDLGYGDLQCAPYNHPHIQTPNLNEFGSQGVVFTNCYAGAPVCSPARAALLTGRTNNRNGIYTICAPRHPLPMHLRSEEVTVAELLKDAGYQTSIVGKWHLSAKFNSPGEPTPLDHGFDYAFVTPINAKPSHRNPDNFHRNGEPVGPLAGYSSTIIVNEAIRWLNARDVDKPFCLFVMLHSPHDPIATPPEYVKMYHPKITKNRGQAEYWGNVTHMDHEIGRLMAALDDPRGLNLKGSTFVMFSSDNGPQPRDDYDGTGNCYGVAGPLRGMKASLYEGGIRVPGMIRWPGRTKPGSRIDEPINFTDVLPTLCEIGGAPVPSDRVIDGASLLPVFQGKPLERPRPLFWANAGAYQTPGGGWRNRDYRQPKVAMRIGDWKILAHWRPPHRRGRLDERYINWIATAKLDGFELYNLRKDPRETANLRDEEPERLERMAETLTELFREIQAEGYRWSAQDARAEKEAK